MNDHRLCLKRNIRSPRCYSTGSNSFDSLRPVRTAWIDHTIRATWAARSIVEKGSRRRLHSPGAWGCMYRKSNVVSSIARQQETRQHGYHGYHSTETVSAGYQGNSSGTTGSHGYQNAAVKLAAMDSTEALFGSPMALENTHKSMKVGALSVVARDGIEPPTPAFSGLSDQSLTKQFLVVS